MPSVEMYLNEQDGAELLAWIDKQAEVAYLVPDGPKRWIAVTRLLTLPTIPTLMWHIPSGVLPLSKATMDGRKDEEIDPFQGWEERQYTRNRPVPWLGGATPKTMDLDINTISRQSNDMNTLGLSSIGWTGDADKALGNPASASTKRFWSRLRSFVRKRGVLVKAAPTLTYASILAFPGALREIQNGRPYARHVETPDPLRFEDYL